MSQRAAAKRAGIDYSYLNKLERGTRPPPGPQVVLQLVDALELDRDGAEQLVTLAGHDPLILQGVFGLGYSSPSTGHSNCGPECDELHTALHRLPPRQRARYVKAVLAFINTLTAQDDGDESDGRATNEH